MAYNANTDYENEKEYLTDQIKQAEKTGNNGLLSWAKKQLGELANAVSQGIVNVKNTVSNAATSITNTNTNTNTNTTSTSSPVQQAQSNNQMNVLNNAVAVSGGTGSSTSTPTTTGSSYYTSMSEEEKRNVAIEAYRDMYEAAIAKGDVGAAGLWARNAAVDYGVTLTPTSTGSSYTPKGTYNDADMSAMDKQLVGVYQDMYESAMAKGDVEAAEKAHTMAEWVRSQYGYSGGGDGSEYIPLNTTKPTTTAPTATGLGSSDIASWNDNYNNNNAQPTYTSKYDPQIDALLNEILTREDFSYNVEDDPLYSQYKQMYNREGERAMRNTLAEAAAGAGGMNTYAIAAAQQANNYYSSQLNDRIPELYQLAYEMYLQDKESKVQDLGILSDMDDKQYNRYRDTMSDWRADKDFAYGTFKDAVTQGNWEKTFNYNQSVDNRNFAYQDYWAEKEWSASEQSKAQDEVWKLISLGVTPSADLVAKAGMSQTDIDLAVAAVNAGGTSTGNNGYTGGSKGNTGNTGSTGYTGDTVTGNPVVSSGITDEIKNKVSSITNNTELGNYLDGLVSAGDITESQADSLYAQNVDNNEKDKYKEMVKSTSGWKVQDDGGTNWLWGVDNNAIVIAPNGEQVRLDNLVDILEDEGMSRSDAKEAVKKLQKNLGI